MLNLVIMAAGLGSRYAGLKQIEGVGPNGELLMDYSIAEAIKCGFSKIVIIVREDFRQTCEELILGRWHRKAQFSFVIQGLNDLPEGFNCPQERKKPWGTGQALLAAKGAVDAPFCLINADNYYGSDTFAQMANFLSSMTFEGYSAGMVSYLLKNTCSPNGSVTRGVCQFSDDYLANIVERHNIIENAGRYYWLDQDQRRTELSADTQVSMNFWGFKPDIFQAAEEGFRLFLKDNINSQSAEFLLPVLVGNLIQENRLKVRVLNTSTQWFGMTYPQDRVLVKEHLQGIAI